MSGFVGRTYEMSTKQPVRTCHIESVTQKASSAEPSGSKIQNGDRMTYSQIATSRAESKR